MKILRRSSKKLKRRSRRARSRRGLSGAPALYPALLIMNIAFITPEGEPFIAKAEYVLINQIDTVTLKQENDTIIIYEGDDPDAKDNSRAEE